MSYEDEELEGEESPRTLRLRSLARRFTNIRDLSSDARELVDTVLESSDRAKTEMVKMVAREVRNYLEELKLKEDLQELVQGHSLEVHLSLSLKPLEDRSAEKASAPPPATPEDPVDEPPEALPDEEEP